MWLSLLSATALACGQTTHIWIALDAMERLPPGPLADLAGDPVVRDALVSGAMFPDGGYSPAVNHPYGEAAHWEPFQIAYADWIRLSFPDLDAPEARLHQAFLLGLVAHGIADQIFDSNYLYRSQRYEPEPWVAYGGADTATDVVYAGAHGGHALADHWVPYEALVPLFAAQGVDVDVATMVAGMASLDLAVLWVGGAAADPAQLAAQEAQFPWANSHLDDPAIPGSPADLIGQVAAYWPAWWSRVHDGAPDRTAVTFAQWPAPPGFAHPTAVDDPGAMVSVAFTTALVRDTIEAPDAVRVTGPDGDHPVDAWMYYGEGSNVLNILPLEDWGDDASYTLTIAAGVTTIDGWQLDAPAEVARFSTGAAPTSPPAEAPGCTHAPAGPMAWLAGLAYAGRVISSRFRRSPERGSATRSSTS